MTVSASGRVHMVGSVPLESAQAVFELIGNDLGDRCCRIPDGETGSRRNWIGWQLSVFAEQPALTQAEERERAYQLHPPFVFAPEMSVSDLAFQDIGFAREAIASYELFSAKKAEGILPEDARFLVAIPTPFAPVYSFTAYAIQEQVFPVYQNAILEELRVICAAIPNDQLAIQWDVATEMSIFESVYDVPFDEVWDTLNGRLAALGNAVPAEVELGYHLCYGSMNNKHWKEPDDLGMCVAVSNEIFKRVSRPIQFLHMPVPIDRNDDAYYAPLSGLEAGDETELYLGMVHDDGPEANRARRAAAEKYWSNFGISAECGLGRWEAEAIPHLVQAHADLADAK